MNEEYSRKNDMSIFDLIKVCLRNIKLIIGMVLLAVIVTVVISLVMSPTYESKAVIVPVGQSGMQNSMSGIALQFSILAGSVQAPNVSEMVNLLKSDVLMLKVVEKNNLFPVFFKQRGPTKGNENEKAWEGIRKLQGILTITENKKDQSIVLKAQYKDPKLTQQIIEYSLNELTEHMSGEAKRVASANRKHLEELIDKTADPFIKQKIYALIAQQIENEMMAEVKENFAYKVIDPPRVPDKRIKPKRRVMVLFAFGIGCFLGIILAFAKEYFDKNRKMWQELKESTRLECRKSRNKANDF